jgi:hypothetical protein
MNTTPNPILNPNVHRFETTGQAYDASQTRDDIADGDVLVVISERVVGVLVSAWPVAVTTEAGAFHGPGLNPGADWSSLDNGDGDGGRTDYSRSVLIAEHIVETEIAEPTPDRFGIVEEWSGVPLDRRPVEMLTRYLTDRGVTIPAGTDHDGLVGLAATLKYGIGFGVELVDGRLVSTARTGLGFETPAEIVDRISDADDLGGDEIETGRDGDGSTCDRCGRPVVFGNPVDADYRAFFHTATGRVSCDPTPAEEIVNPNHVPVDVPRSADEIAALIGAAIEIEPGIDEIIDYDRAGVLTNDPGLVIRTIDGAEYQVTIVQSRPGSGEAGR